MGLCWAELCNKHSTDTASQVFGNSAAAHFSLCCPNGLALLIRFARYNKLDAYLKMGASFKRNGGKRENLRELDEIYKKHCRPYKDALYLVCW